MLAAAGAWVALRPGANPLVKPDPAGSPAPTSACAAALEEERLFAQPANLTTVKQVAERFAEDEDSLSECVDPHVVASLLLHQLRQLPDPLLPSEDLHALEPSGGPVTPAQHSPSAAAAPARNVPFDLVLRALHDCSRAQFFTLWNVAELLYDHAASAPPGDVAESLDGLAFHVGPTLCRPANGAYMSIKHLAVLPFVRAVARTLLADECAVFKVGTAPTNMPHRPSLLLLVAPEHARPCTARAPPRGRAASRPSAASSSASPASPSTT